MYSFQLVDVEERAKDVGAAPLNDEFSLEEQAQWIKGNIKMRVCRTFVKKDQNESLSDDTLCKCGKMKKDHQLTLKYSETDQWHIETNTEALPTDAFGEIEFIGHGKNERKFVRVDVNTDMEKMKHLMMNVWRLGTPNLLISVTGGANHFNMKSKLKEAFRRGLMKAARSTGAWIVTGGTYTGVMKHVGEAVRDYGLTATSGAPVVAIGVATWGCIHKKEELIGQGNEPAQYRVSSEKIKVKKEAYLDPNHTHFILVDNGTEHQFELEFPLENAVSNMTTDIGKDAVKVPVCLLVVEGGPVTLKTAQESIQNNIPIIIVQGSGRAADILATAYQCSKENEKEYVDKVGNKTETKFDSTQKAKIVDMIKDVFGAQNIEENWEMVKKSLVNRDLVTVFDLNPASTNQAQRDIDYAILKALLKANKDQVYHQLKLALAWNRIDIAKREIFVDNSTWKKGSLDDILRSAIMKDRKDFIELFLDHGVSLKDFLTMPRLVELYDQIPPNCHLAMTLRKTKQKYNSSDKGSKVTLVDVGHLIQDLIGYSYASHHLTATDVGETNSSKDSTAKYNPVQELFFWSVLMNRQELAKLFWHLGKDAVAGALVAYGLLEKLSKKTDDVELKKSFVRNAKEFSDLAISVLNECHETDEKEAQNLLVRQLDDWGGATCVLIAVKTENKQFISQTACQSLLSRVWMGRLSNENGAIRLLGCVFVPPLMFPFIKYLEEEKKNPSSIGMDNLDVKAKMPKDDGKHGGMIRPPVSILKKIYDFYTSPVIIFVHNVLSYLVFLALFSYMLLVELNSSVSVIEIVLMVWVFSICAEEIRQFLNPPFAERMKIRKQEPLFRPTEKPKENKYVIMSAASSPKTKLLSYFTNFWNMVDVLTIVLFVCALILRFLPHHSTLEAARVVYAVTFITFCLRILHIFAVHRELGLKLVMIGEMFYDLSYFMVILMVFVVSFAIASYSILYPNSSLSADVVLKVMRMSYWNLYGELFIEDLELEEPECSFDPALYGNNTLPRCPSHVGRFATPIILGIYVLFANILLLNLIIAMFSFSVQKIQEEIDHNHDWNFQRYVLIYEYCSKPPLPTPLILISHIYLFFRWMFERCCGCCVSDDKSDLIKIFDNERELVQWENVMADSYLHRLDTKEFEKLDNQVQLIHKRLDALLVRMDEVQDSNQPQPAASAGNSTVQHIVKMPPQLEKRLSSLEDQMQTKWSMNAMKSGENVLQPAVLDPAKKREEADAYLDRLEMKEFEKLDNKVQLTHERLDALLERMDEVQDSHQPQPAASPGNYTEQPIVKMPPQLEKRLSSLEDQGYVMSKKMQTTCDSLKWIMNAIKSGVNVSQPAVLDPAKKREEA